MLALIYAGDNNSNDPLIPVKGESVFGTELNRLATMTKLLQDSICNMDCDNCNFCHGDFMNCAISDFRDCLQEYINGKCN